MGFCSRRREILWLTAMSYDRLIVKTLERIQ